MDTAHPRPGTDERTDDETSAARAGTVPGSMQLLEGARAELQRLAPRQARDEQLAGATIVDLRTDRQRAVGGNIPGALAIDLTVLPWRLDPAFEFSIPEATSPDQRWILVCRHGYSSSVAAWTLHQAGLANVTDIDGGFEAWQEAGLPVTDEPADVRE